MSLQIERDPTSSQPYVLRRHIQQRPQDYPELTFCADMDGILYRDGWYFLRHHILHGLDRTWSCTATTGTEFRFYMFSGTSTNAQTTSIPTPIPTTYTVPTTILSHHSHHLDLVIPNPCYRYGEFYDMIAIYIDPSVIGYAGEQSTEVYYFQYGNWAGPYLVRITEEQLVQIRDAPHYDTQNYTVPGTFETNIVFHSDASMPDETIMVHRPEINPGQMASDLIRRINDIGRHEQRDLERQYAERTPEQSFEVIVQRHEIENAYHKSKALLKEWLTPSEYESIIKCDKAIFPSKLSPDCEYIVYSDGGMVDVYRSGEFLERRCIHIDRRYTAYDCVLSQILLLKSNEMLFKQISNGHPQNLG